MISRILSLVALLSVLPSAGATVTNRLPTHAETSNKPSLPEKITTISSIFGQLVKFSIPKGFIDVATSSDKGTYIREAVPAGETAERWSQMVTLIANQDLALNPKVTPQGYANVFAAGFQLACPASFGATSLGDFKLGGHDAFAAVISCGTVKTHSESTLLIVIKGSSAYYTIQWAERSNPVASPIEFDEAKWTERFKMLMPIKLCPIIQGEPEPYESCLNA